MTTLDAAKNDTGSVDPTRALTRGTLVAAALAVCIAQVALAIPAVLNGLFQQDLGTSSSQLTWISDAFLVPVTLLELTFGVLGDLFGRKRLLVGGAVLIAVGELIAVLTPGASASTDTRVLILWTGQILAGIGAAALFPTSLAMVAAGTHTMRHRARSISIWAAALSTGGFISPLIGGLVTKAKFGSDPDASWRWAFVAVVVLGLLSAAVSAIFAKNSSAPAGRSLDWPGQITIAVALFALLFAVIQGPTSGWSSGEVIGGFILAAVALAAFIMVENRTASPLLRLSLFTNRAFAIAAIVTVFGMFSFLGTAYATSIRLSAIQGFTPLRTSIAFVLLNGMCLVQMPVTSRLLERYNPKWALGAGAALIGIGDLWMSTISATTTSLPSIAAPLVLIGIGFGFAVSAVTAVAVNTVPNHLAGMASGSTSLLRDFGFTLGPAVIGAIALSRAATEIQNKIGGSVALQKALAAFNASAAHAPAAQKPAIEGAIGAVNSGPLGANGVPGTVTLPTGKTTAFNPLKDVAFKALDDAYSLGYVICGVAALLAAALAIFALGGRTNETMMNAESLA
jgi:MFS family permease